MFSRWKHKREMKRLARLAAEEQLQLQAISNRMAAAVIGPMDAQRVKRRDDAHYRRFIAAEFASIKAARVADVAALGARRLPGREDRGNGSYGDYDRIDLDWRTLL